MRIEEAPREPGRAWLVPFFGVTLALAGLSVYVLWGFSRIMEGSIELAFRRPMPPLTMLFIDHRIWLALFPVPWLIAATYLSIRGRPAPHVLVMFSSTLLLSLLTLSLFVGLAFSLPWLPTKIRSITPASAALSTPAPAQ